MRPDEIPSDVLRFIERRIDSVPHLEALLLLWEHHTQVWTEEAVAKRIYVANDRASAVLQDLVRDRLIVEVQQPLTYQYDPSTEHAATIAKLADAYRRHLVVIATLIHSKASAAVRDFARAFEIKKRD